MRARVSLPALLVAVLPALVFAYPAIGGGRGLLRVQNALVEDDAGLTISVHTVNRMKAYPFPDAPDEPGANPTDLIGALSITPVATKYVGVELFGSYNEVLMVRLPTKAEWPVQGFRFAAGARAAVAGGKLSVPVLPVLKLGFSGRYTFLNASTDWPDPGALPVAPIPKLEWRGLATVQFQDLAPSAPNLMFNFGSVGPGAVYGMGVEWAARSIAFFAEAVSQQDSGSTGPFDSKNGRILFTPGVALGSPTGTALRAAYTFASGKGAVSELVIGLCIAAPFARRASRQTGSVTGIVTNSLSGAPVTADIRFPDNRRLRPLKSDSITGIFKVAKVPAGAVTVEVSAPGYNTQTVPIAVKSNEFSQYEFKLRPTVVSGTIAGVVTDAVTGQPLVARIEFPNSEFAPITTDTTGTFRIANAPAGAYTVTATADEHTRGTLAVVVDEGRSATASFALNPAAVRLAGKTSDRKTGASIAATVSFPGTTLAGVTADSGTGVYKADLPAGSYAVQVEAPGYIKQTAAIILDKDKPIIRDFELVAEGMSITLRGIYFDFDKATIKRESRPALEDAAKILKENPTIQVEIQGHTDSKGSDAYNLSLSDRRAGAVVNYLVQNLGIEQTRLTAKGYGESMPIATNDTDAGRVLNRRVEFFILGQK